MNDIREALIHFVEARNAPKIEELITQDRPHYGMIQHLLSMLLGLPITAAAVSGEETRFLTPSGLPILTIFTTQSGECTLTGDMASKLNPLLFAIRIHEVDSFDLVYVPQEERRRTVDEMSAEVGISTQELNRLTTLWMQNGHRPK